MLQRRKEPIHLALRAIMDDDAPALARLIDAGLSIESTDSSGAPLMFFCVEGRLDCLALLLSLGANPAHRCPDGSTPAMRAARTCPVSFALLAAASDPWAPSDNQGNNVLHHASMGQTPHGLLALRLALGMAPLSAIHAPNLHGMDPLASACRLDNDQALRILLPSSDPLAPNSVTGLSPLAYCIEHDRPLCARVLWDIPGALGQLVDGLPMLAWAIGLSSRAPHRSGWPWLAGKVAFAEREALLANHQSHAPPSSSYVRL